MSSDVTTVPHRSLENVLSGGAGGWLRNGFPRRVIFKMLLIIFTLVRELNPFLVFYFTLYGGGPQAVGRGHRLVPGAGLKDRAGAMGLVSLLQKPPSILGRVGKCRPDNPQEVSGPYILVWTCSRSNSLSCSGPWTHEALFPKHTQPSVFPK